MAIVQENAEEQNLVNERLDCLKFYFGSTIITGFELFKQEQAELFEVDKTGLHVDACLEEYLNRVMTEPGFAEQYAIDTKEVDVTKIMGLDAKGLESLSGFTQNVQQEMDLRPQFRERAASSIQAGFEDMIATIIENPGVEIGIDASGYPAMAGDKQFGGALRFGSPECHATSHIEQSMDCSQHMVVENKNGGIGSPTATPGTERSADQDAGRG